MGGVVTAPVTTFRTQVYTKKVYDLTAITFSLPSAEGLITVSAPNGTLDPGTTVLIINGGNGVVLGLTAGNGGQLQGTLPAGIDDILFVTVTDPFGNATSFQRSEFVDPVTGETAVGAFGGTVRGPAGSSLVIPEQALDKGTKFKLDYVTPDAVVELLTKHFAETIRGYGFAQVRPGSVCFEAKIVHARCRHGIRRRLQISTASTTGNATSLGRARSSSRIAACASTSSTVRSPPRRR